MTLKEVLRQILEQHNHTQNAPDDVLFKLLSPYCLHKTLAKGSPYSDDGGGVRQKYVAECVDIAADMYRRLAFGPELLLDYEDCYSEKNQEEIRFFESCLKGGGEAEIYSFLWKHRPVKGIYPAALANNSDVYTCTRRLYKAKDIKAQCLFKEIILSDIGGQYDLASKIFIIDTSTACIFHLYDDRGLWVSGPEGTYFPQRES